MFIYGVRTDTKIMVEIKQVWKKKLGAGSNSKVGVSGENSTGIVMRLKVFKHARIGFSWAVH